MIKTAKELAAACKEVATNHKTLYVMGCFGAPMTDYNKQRYIGHHSYNAQAARKKKILAASADTFGFDCVCFIKGLLWGWNGNANDIYGGANYAANDVPDISADGMIKVCKDVSTDFSNIQVGEVVWLSQHIGVYIGDGLVVECTPAWSDGVQITALGNIGTKAGYNTRTWKKHGKLPYVQYTSNATQGGPQATNAAQSGGNTLVQVSVRVLKKGSKGEDVKALQALLNGHGYGLDADGSFGGKTLNALKAYQKANGLAVDGSCGPATWGSLLGSD